MQQVYPSIPQEVKDRLKKKGFVPHQHDALHEFLNPHSGLYWATNFFLAFVAWGGRSAAMRTGAPRFLWSSVIIGIPICAVMTRARLDHPKDVLGHRLSHRKTLVERLDYSPITRRAWFKALNINNAYQDELKAEIEALEKKLGK